MACKKKRIIYSDAECHRLVDLISSYRSIIECKKTDATTWKQKNDAWDKIAEMYNSATTELRTSEQLRCKYDNLKKEVRKYKAHKRPNLYKTDGGLSDPDVKTIIKLLYDKISFLSYSVDCLKPSESDTNVTVQVENTKKWDVDNMEEAIFQIPELPQLQAEVIVPEDNKDYIPKMLKLKELQVLQNKRKKNDEEQFEEDNMDNYNRKMFDLKTHLLESERRRVEPYHEMKIRKEEELYNLKIKNQKLQNKKLELEISLLKKQLQK